MASGLPDRETAATNPIPPGWGSVKSPVGPMWRRDDGLARVVDTLEGDFLGYMHFDSKARVMAYSAQEAMSYLDTWIRNNSPASLEKQHGEK